jgi:hypothetical protein
LPEGVNKRLTAYALAAAAAAGVGVLALAEPAQADIIGSSVNIAGSAANPMGTLNIAGSHALGFEFNQVSSPLSHTIFGGPCPGCKVVDTAIKFAGIGASAFGLPLSRGSAIGASRAFVRTGNIASAFVGFSGGGGVLFSGFPNFLWNGRTGYLGFEFGSKGKDYFGWAKVSASLFAKSAHVTECAYNTVPGQGIVAGEDSAVPEPGTLLLLALGAAGLMALRKRKLSAVSDQPTTK